MFEIYDDRTNEVVFSSEEKIDCLIFLAELKQDDERFQHYWLRNK